jgi:hypothetical protein
MTWDSDVYIGYNYFDYFRDCAGARVCRPDKNGRRTEEETSIRTRAEGHHRKSDQTTEEKSVNPKTPFRTKRAKPNRRQCLTN